jgi:glycosyltransferase involved in cell wall biosynthesis
MPDMKISVIICAHNPRPDYFARVLAALKAQDLPAREWELLVIDNASEVPIRDRFDFSWHPSVRFLEEKELGLTAARLRGLREARAPIFVLVDDDNVLAPDFLRVALGLGEEFPAVGAWGGQLIPEFEKEPAAELREFDLCLALREFTERKVTYAGMDPIPFGAGLCLRREVGQAYLGSIEAHPIRKLMDRRGKSLLGGGDIDLALTSRRLGLGLALFPELKLQHLMPAWRTEPDYLYRLCVAGTYSWMLARYFNGEPFKARRGRRRIKSLVLRCRGKLTPERRAWAEGMDLVERDIRRLKARKNKAVQESLDKRPAGTPTWTPFP